MNILPCNREATPVVPLPIKGSNTTQSEGQRDFTSLSINATGNWQGCFVFSI